ncbi:PPC domain-containing protein [Microcoleus sp. FACHB-1515]|uniref:PPC domain-containing protein n=1 Tax=Cyanophyceae TaxID=3028117 RepID=UPI0016825249|nr:PPC domain-containing protein [Microcoleus sp. FACHB-1515]MBD2090610.1 PPC domain-containing protein [Microcoleus sp. FACHB-1515]
MRSAKLHLWFALFAYGFALPALAQTPAIDTLQTQLQAAICLNDWPQAIDLTNQLIGSDDLSPEDRESLVNYRSQLQNWRATGARFANLPNCNAANPAVAIAPQSTTTIENSVAIAPQPLSLVALSPAVNLDFVTGAATHSGAVSSGQQVYSFTASAGDRLSIDVNVTRIMPGTPFMDDDSQLFLFDAAGRLIAQNDDQERSFQSRLANFTIPADGTYFVVVTTFNNDPILNANGIILRWEGDGGSNIEYLLTISKQAN